MRLFDYLSPARPAHVRAGALTALALFAGFGCGEDSPPAADLAEELQGGDGPFVAAAANGGALPEGYELHEYVAAGTAVAYAAGPDGLPDDGRWTLEAPSSAAYRTRILVRRPSDPSAASGTVIVEWLNVSGGIDADADYITLAEEIARQGHIWVGVSAQIVGVEGGDTLVTVGAIADGYAGQGLKKIDPARYGSLVHPGDGYAFDIFTQIARALRRGGEVLGGVEPEVLIAAGESQSAMALTTYYDGVQPETRAFDGFFVHSRGSFPLPFVGPGEAVDLASAILTSKSHPIFRDDLSAPVMNIQTESDVGSILKSARVHQDDSETYRLWEVAGTAHADRHLLGPAADSIDCGAPVNDGPMHLVAKAAFRALDAWVRTGEAPLIAPRLDADSGVARDEDGIALGGIRTPPVDVPVDVLSGVPGDMALICVLLGSTTPLPDTRVAELYPSRAAYQAEFEAATDATIAAGFVLEEDRDALLAFAKPERVSP
jgi:hypothetical protein